MGLFPLFFLSNMQDVVYHYIKVQESFTNKQTQKAGHPMLLLQLQLQANAPRKRDASDDADGL